MTQKTPTSKVTAAGVFGALALAVVTIVDAGWPIPAEWASAVTALAAVAAAYLKREKRPTL